MLKTSKEKADAYAQQEERCVTDIEVLAIPETVLHLEQDIHTCTKHEVEIVL